MTSELAVHGPEWLPESGSITETVKNILDRGKELRNDSNAWEQLKEAWAQADLAEQSTQWFKAQIAYTVVKVFGDNRTTMDQFCNELRQLGIGISRSRLSQYIATYEAFKEIESRSPQLSFSHHMLCAYTSRPKKWLETAVDESLTTLELRKRINAKKREKAITYDAGEENGEIVLKQIREAVTGLAPYITDRQLCEMLFDELAKSLAVTGNLNLAITALRRIAEADNQMP